MLLLNLLIYGWFSSFSEIKGNFLISSDVKFSFHMTLENFSNHYFNTISVIIIISDAAGTTSYKEVFFVCEYKETDHKNTLSWISTTEHMWTEHLDSEYNNNSLKLFFIKRLTQDQLILHATHLNRLFSTHSINQWLYTTYGWN